MNRFSLCARAAPRKTARSNLLGYSSVSGRHFHGWSALGLEQMGVSNFRGLVDEIPARPAVIQMEQEGQFVVQAQLILHEGLKELLIAMPSAGSRLSYHSCWPYRSAGFATLCDRSPEARGVQRGCL